MGEKTGVTIDVMARTTVTRTECMRGCGRRRGEGDVEW